MFAKRLIRRALRQTFVVTLPGNEGAFVGIMTDCDNTYWIFDECQEVTTKPGQTPERWAGRVWVKHAQNPAPYLQEVDPRV
jgi:hypothetical protein